MDYIRLPFSINMKPDVYMFEMPVVPYPNKTVPVNPPQCNSISANFQPTVFYILNNDIYNFKLAHSL